MPAQPRLRLCREAGKLALAAVVLGGSAISSVGCIGGVRGYSEFDRVESLDGIDTLVVELPESGVSVRTQASEDVTYRGRWWAVGPSAAQAERSAGVAGWVFERAGPLARLAADIPLEIEGVVGLELEELWVPPDLDLTLVSEGGAIAARGLGGHLAVMADGGDVRVTAGAGSVSVATHRGDVEVSTTSHIDVVNGDGAVLVWSSDGGADVVIHAELGDVTVHIARDADLDVQIDAHGIEIETARIQHRGEGSYRRSLGDASVRLWIDAPHGDVRVDAEVADAP